MPKVSVIIPVYNVEAYLRECLDSVVDQTLQDIEIICVDDGSTDSSSHILDEYAASDSRVKVIHKANGGYGQAMNVGMDAATGEYLGIVESDDWVLPNMFEALYEKAARHNLDLVKSDHYRYYGKRHVKKRYCNTQLSPYYGQVLTAEDRSLFWKTDIANWSGIYKLAFLRGNDIRHRESPGASYQDTGFRVQVMAMARRGMWIDGAFYMYRQDNPGSSVKNRQKMLEVMHEYDHAGKILLDKGMVQEWRQCNALRMGGHQWVFYRIGDALKKEYAHIIRDDHLKYRDHIDWSPYEKPEALTDWLQALVHDPDGFAEETVVRIQKNSVPLQKAGRIILYGAGQRALTVWEKLLSISYLDKVSFVAVTHLEGQRRFKELEVRPADEITRCAGNTLVLICVSKKNSPAAYREIVENLDRLGVTNYMDTESVALWR